MNDALQICVHFCKMDGYALYVWPAYGVAAVALIGLTVWISRALHKKRREAAALDQE